MSNKAMREQRYRESIGHKPYTAPVRPRLPITEAEAAEWLNITPQALAHRRRRGTGLPYTIGRCRGGQRGALYDPLDVELERQRDVELRRLHPVIDSWRRA